MYCVRLACHRRLYISLAGSTLVPIETIAPSNPIHGHAFSLRNLHPEHGPLHAFFERNLVHFAVTSWRGTRRPGYFQKLRCGISDRAVAQHVNVSKPPLTQTPPTSTFVPYELSQSHVSLPIEFRSIRHRTPTVRDRRLTAHLASYLPGSTMILLKGSATVPTSARSRLSPCSSRERSIGIPLREFCSNQRSILMRRRGTVRYRGGRRSRRGARAWPGFCALHTCMSMC